MSDGSDEYGEFIERRNRRTKIVAWSVIISMVLVGGGSTVLTMIFG